MFTNVIMGTDAERLSLSAATANSLRNYAFLAVDTGYMWQWNGVQWNIAIQAGPGNTHGENLTDGFGNNITTGTDIIQVVGNGTVVV
jgi:hypothetical protein